jgi:hypothetical protein
MEGVQGGCMCDDGSTRGRLFKVGACVMMAQLEEGEQASDSLGTTSHLVIDLCLRSSLTRRHMQDEGNG